MRKIYSFTVFFSILILAGGFVYFYSSGYLPTILGTSTSREGNRFGLEDLREKAGKDAKYSVDRNTGKVTFLSEGKAKSLPFNLQKMAKAEPSAAAGQFMKEYGGYFGLDDSAKELKILDKEKDDLGMIHISYNQIYQDVPVFGAQAIVHVKKDLSVSSANGKLVPDISLKTNPDLSQKEAEEKAGESWKKQFDGGEYQVKKTTLYIFNKGLAENKKDDKNYLTWQVELASTDQKKHEFYFIDAGNGKLVFQITGIKNAIHRHVYDCTWGSCVMDYLYSGYYYGRSEGQAVRGANPVNGGTDVDNLYDITNSMHNYLSSKFSRNGGNNLGGIGDGVYAAAANTESFAYIDPMNWTACPNAFFSGYDINFCKGFVSTDIVGHEYGHGIVSFSVPGDLTYYGESGALNEGYADIFGEALENYRSGSNDWLMGASINVGGLTGPFRNLQNPAALSDPDRFYSSNFYCGTSDNAGVHTNSTVLGHAAYLMAMGGTFNGCSISGIGKDKEERIYYRALTSYFISSTDFNGAYNAFNQACSDLYGSGSADCTETKKALQSVEMDQGGQCSGEARIQPCSSTLPVISGVTDGATYENSVTVTFDKGTATLNGASFSSGSIVSEDGSYVLIVTDSVNNISTTVNFHVNKFSTNTPTLPYNISKKAKRTITVTFRDKTISTKRKWVTARLGGRKVKVTRIRNSGGNFILSLNFNYRKWPVGGYALAVSYKSKVGRTYRKGNLSKDNALSII
jgi:Zn-dependent metalloprotease